MFDVFIIGHSLSDPDIDFVLQLARTQRSPQHPIYMVAAGFSGSEEQDLFEQYNIELVRYSNSDGTHFELRRMLRAVDRFITPRGQSTNTWIATERPEAEVKTAVALFLFRRLQRVPPKEYLAPLVLLAVCTDTSGTLPTESVYTLPTIASLTKNGTAHNDSISRAVDHLVHEGFLINTTDGLCVTESGRTRVAEYHTVRQLERDQAYSKFEIDLTQSYGGGLSSSQLTDCQTLAERVLVTSFEHRGSVIANKVFSDRPARRDELSDVFGYVTDQARRIPDKRLQAAFIEAVHGFLVEPDVRQKAYLASVSQGYFLYHLLGLDPGGAHARREIFRKTLWICDSSVILPWIAKGCHNHDYASELFRMLAEEQALLCTTPRLLQEVWEHLNWAISLMRQSRSPSLGLLRAASVKGTYKQNLFIDGFIRLSSEGVVGTFQDYLRLILNGRNSDRTLFERSIERDGLRLINVSQLQGFVQEDWGHIEAAKVDIQKRREQIGTYRSPLQVESEAEVSILLNRLRSGTYAIDDLENADHFYFISQSLIIDRVFQEDDITTWTPESLYRYLTTLPERDLDPDLLQQCMLHEYFYAGVSFVDTERYERFFGPLIDVAKASFEKEISEYVKDLESHAIGIEDAFAQTPDLEKPFFLAQMGWQKAEAANQREELATLRADRAERELQQLKSEDKRASRRRSRARRSQELARRRNLLDPRHVRKRKRQAKKRKRRKNP